MRRGMLSCGLLASDARRHVRLLPLFLHSAAQEAAALELFDFDPEAVLLQRAQAPPPCSTTLCSRRDIADVGLLPARLLLACYFWPPGRP